MRWLAMVLAVVTILAVCGCTERFRSWTMGPVRARFIAGPTSGPAPLTVQFCDRSKGSPRYWSWNFGDGEHSIAKHPKHTYSTPGKYTVRLSVERGWGTGDDQDYVTIVDCITVQPPLPPLKIVSVTLPHAVVGQAYGPEQLTATGGVTPYTWSEDGSNLAAYGLTLNLDGTITGTPTQAGICNFTAKVTDSSNPALEATKELGLPIGFFITTTSLPDGAVGEPYGPVLLSAVGGTTPYTWVEVGSNLGTYGLTLYPDGSISGTLTQAGICNFTAEVADSSSPSQSAQKALTITILEQPFVKTWGGTGYEELFEVEVDSGRNIYCAGWTDSFGPGPGDVLLLKYDSSGVLQWAKTWGGTLDDMLRGIAVNTTGNIYSAGRTQSFGAGVHDTLLLKYDASGALQWARTWGGTNGEWTSGVALDSSGNIYCAGSTASFGAGSCDALLLKYDASGALQWARTWGDIDYEYIRSLAVDSGDNIYCAGRTESFGAGSVDALLLKYDTSGALQWARAWGGTADDRIEGVAVDSGGSIYAAGETKSFGVGNWDAFLLKYDDSGTLLWGKTYGGSGGDLTHDVAVSSTGDIYTVGYTLNFGAGIYDALLLKYNDSGTLLWAKTWGGGAEEFTYDVLVDSSGNTFLGGRTLSYTGVWQTVTGTEGTPSGTETSPSGSESSPAGTETSPTGTEGSPTGDETGAGGYDTLLLKNW